MNRIYLDNASTTFLRNEVIDSMIKIIKKFYGNPSSPHWFGRKSRFIIEKSRKLIANSINAHPSEIIFTSSGTEANNLILRSSIISLKIKRIITSPLEHLSVIKTILDIYKNYKINIEFIKLKKKGEIDIENLEKKLKNNSSTTLVSLMYANNEIGNILDVKNIGFICKKYNSYFHSDTVQYMGHYKINMKKLPFHFASASAHKFYGPVGIGFAFIRNSIKLKSIITGGNQEKNIRAGTENIYGIVGLANALNLANINLNFEKKKIEKLKKYCIFSLKKEIPEVIFNGLCNDNNKSIYTILNIFIPIKNDLIYFYLDLKGISISNGSSCFTSSKISHVIKHISNIKKLNNMTPIRISFSIFNKKKDIDFLILHLKKLIFFLKKNKY